MSYYKKNREALLKLIKNITMVVLKEKLLIIIKKTEEIKKRERKRYKEMDKYEKKDKIQRSLDRLKKQRQEDTI